MSHLYDIKGNDCTNSNNQINILKEFTSKLPKAPISPDAKHTLEIYAKISQIKKIPKGQTVGYGGSYTTKRDTVMALVHIGYKDGYLRLLSEMDSAPKGVYMCINGYRAPIIGKISLDATTVDVTDIPDNILKQATYAEVVGPNVDIKVIADKSGCYEVMVALGRDNKKMNDYTLKEYKTSFECI